MTTRARRWMPRPLAPSLVAAALGCSPSPQGASPQPAVVAVPVATERASGGDEPNGYEARPQEGVIDGVGGVHLGQSVAVVRRVLGRENGTRTRDEEAEAWESSGYDTETEPLFLIGFDRALVYEGSADTKVPIWKVYVRDDRVVFIKASAFGFENLSGIRQFGFAPSCYFLGDPEGIVATFGQGYFKQVRAGWSSRQPEAQNSRDYEMHYFDKGISIIVVDDSIRVFDIYGALDGATRGAIERAVSSPGRAGAKKGQ